jgi:hypothetical protein
MGAPTSEVGYTSATTRRGDHEVYMGMWWKWGKKSRTEYLQPMLLEKRLFIVIGIRFCVVRTEQFEMNCIITT